MAGEIFIAKESTSQAIKTVVDQINAKPSPTPTTDIIKLKPYKLSSSYGSGGSGFLTVLNISGKGFLSKALAHMPDTQDLQIRVTIDGVVKIFTATKLKNNQVTGFLKPYHVMGDTTFKTAMKGALPTFDFNGNLDYPTSVLSSVAYAQTVLLSNDIPFETSLLVEITKTTTNAFYEIEYSLLV